MGSRLLVSASQNADPLPTHSELETVPGAPGSPGGPAFLGGLGDAVSSGALKSHDGVSLAESSPAVCAPAIPAIGVPLNSAEHSGVIPFGVFLPSVLSLSGF